MRPAFAASLPARSAPLRAASAALRTALVLDFISQPYGAAYGVGPRERARLAWACHRIVRAVPAGTTPLSLLVMAREILTLPPDLVGALVECGTWKGASAAFLSLVAALVGRKLIICDSFAGLPDVGDQHYLAPHSRVYGYLRGGMFAGGQEEVSATLRAFGRPEVCEFVVGYYAESLRGWGRPVAFAFLDVDLPVSFHACLRALWPHLAEGGALYVDDVRWMSVAQVFFDEAWWQGQLGCAAPGLVGSGCGLPISVYASNIGYVRKQPAFDAASWTRDPHLAAHP